jgi:hypothetical protein
VLILGALANGGGLVKNGPGVLVLSGNSTQLSSDELAPLVGPAVQVSVAGSKIAVRVSRRLPSSRRPSGSTALAASPTSSQPGGGDSSVQVSTTGS